MYYWAKLYADQLGDGDRYKHLRKAIAIHVLNFISVANAPKYVNKFVITNEETTLRHFEDLEIYTIELCKFSAQADENIKELLPRIKNGLDRWAVFLTKASHLDRNNLPKELDDPCIKKAIDVLTHTSLNKEEREQYEGHLKWMRIEESTLERAKEESKEEGRAEGLAKGLEREMKVRREIASDLLSQGMQIAVVCKITGLLKEELL